MTLKANSNLCELLPNSSISIFEVLMLTD